MGLLALLLLAGMMKVSHEDDCWVSLGLGYREGMEAVSFVLLGRGASEEQ